LKGSFDAVQNLLIVQNPCIGSPLMKYEKINSSKSSKRTMITKKGNSMTTLSGTKTAQ